MKKITLCYQDDRVLDQEILKELDEIGGEPGVLVKSLVEVFQMTADETIGRARKGAQSGNKLDFSESVHKLKGSSGSIGALALFNCCKEVDKLIKGDLVETEEFDSLTDCIQSEYKRACASLESYLHRPTKS